MSRVAIKLFWDNQRGTSVGMSSVFMLMWFGDLYRFKVLFVSLETQSLRF